MKFLLRKYIFFLEIWFDFEKVVLALPDCHVVFQASRLHMATGSADLDLFMHSSRIWHHKSKHIPADKSMKNIFPTSF